jgi:hypothetical protein
MFEDSLTDLSAAIFGAFSDQALFNNAYVVNVILDKNVERTAEYGEVIFNSYEITVSHQEVDRVTINDTFDVGSDSYKVTKIMVSDDRLTVAAVVKTS